MKKHKLPTFAVIDAETDPFDGENIPKPFIWGFYDGETYQAFDTTAALAEVLADYEGIVYAHNGGKFDFHFLLEYVEPYEEIMIINGRISKMRLGECELRDSYNLLPVPLSAYKKDDFDYSLMKKGKREKPAVAKKIREYLQNDCLYLYELLTRFFEEYGLNLTQAGTAMKQWKAIAPIDVAITNKVFYDTFSPYYYGGRVQCFEKGIIDADFQVYDINSAYPFAMLHDHPYSGNYNNYSYRHPQADFLTVRATATGGAWPFRNANGLCFPDDNVARDYTITKWEYDAAIETNSIGSHTVIQSFVFCGHLNFAEYVNHFYALRKIAKAKNDDAGSLIAKLLLNSLYGKFSSNPQEYRNYMIFPMEHAASMDHYGWSFAGDFGPWALGEAALDENRQRFYNVATGASITGFVRAMLWKAIHGCDRVLYCDTDSIAAVGDVSHIPMGSELGQWKDEGEFTQAGIAGKKLYIFRGKDGDDKMASKGVRLDAAQLWRVARGETVTYHPIAPTFSVRSEPRFTARTVKIT